MEAQFQWAVIGAGPAGIAMVGQLLDRGVSPDDILWVDPAFEVGDLGANWFAVPSNTRVALFLEFLRACQSFNFNACPADLSMADLDPDGTCLLGEMVKPLQWITNHLCKTVTSVKTYVKQLSLHDCVWHLVADQNYTAKNVVLAMGSLSKTLSYTGVETISMPQALNPDKLEQHCGVDDRVAVFGSSHSAVLVIKNLIERGVKSIHNFYRSPLKYAVPLDDRILFDNTGLKGMAADWARQYLDGVQPDSLHRHLSNQENIDRYLTQCNKAIYAVGFERRLIDVMGVDLSQYNDVYGIIAPGLFGVGIAYPERVQDPHNYVEYNVGLWKFMQYLNRVLPIWQKYTC